MTTIDEILTQYEASEPAADRAWRNLVTAAGGLGAALARFDLAVKAYGAAQRGEHV